MKVYWIQAQAPRRVLALVKHLGIEAEFVHLDLAELKKPDYARLNPNMKAPTIVDGDTVLWESNAIMAHLCVKTGSKMWPADNPEEQIQVMRWLAWNDCHWARAVGDFYFEHIVKVGFGAAPDRELLKTKVDDARRFGKVLDDHLAGRDYVACRRLTIADFALASMATDWREAEMPFAEFPNVVRWLDGLMRIPAWADPWPSR
ncbi:glutathione S-transferase family protein [Labilithrix luteola]|uniref:glutathione S-transferase family protein n=1 Tax=Labilithrix luteola TaxID=1391654 RepID=UPI0011BA50C2